MVTLNTLIATHNDVQINELYALELPSSDRDNFHEISCLSKRLVILFVLHCNVFYYTQIVDWSYDSTNHVICNCKCRN